MNKKYRHIVMNGNRLRSVLMAAMLLMSGTAMADETGGVRVGGSVYGGGNLAKVAGSCTVNINQEGAVVTNDVYGGGAKAHVNTSDGTTATEGATTTVTLTKGTVGGSVYGGGLGQQQRAAQAATESSPAVEAQDAIPANVFGTVKVTVNGGTAQNVFGCNNLNGSPQQDVTVNIAGGTINEDVYGGGHEADALGQITVNVKGGTVKRDVYGGGALASTNMRSTTTTDPETNVTTTTYPTTTVSLTGGKIGNAYGGGLGDTNTPAYVWGDVTIEVNGTAFTQEVEQNVTNEDGTPISKTGRVFGCNNVNGSPKGHVVVNVRRTVEGDVKRTEEDDIDSEDASKHKYEIAAVYGGGNLAAYEPVSDSEATEVHIYGCEDTSIYQVYGGGNAASTPATVVNIHETYEIGEVFGGGNGKDKIYLGNEWTNNPGANVGYKEYAEGTSYEDRNSSTYTYGTGRAQVNVGGGKIHYVFGGSNTKGNVREIAVAMLEEIKNGDTPVCKFDVDEAYGGGKSAEMDGRAMLDVGCIPGLKAVYGGAMNAPVNNDASLRIINGNFGKVYGGNNLGGSIKGSVTVEIEEVGCNAINIDELYGGGNNAAYSVEDINKSRTTDFDFGDETAENYYKNYPLVKIISATSIGKVFGGGDNADVTGNPHVLIDMVAGVLNSNNDIENDESTKADNVTQELGKIGQVFGGGNNAGVTGSTYINFVKGQIKKIVTTPASEGVTEVAIMPGIYGGCNTKGTVSANTHVVLSGVPTETQAIAEIGATGALAEICGGGLGEETKVQGTAHVDLGSVTPGTEGADDTYSGSASVIGDIYGGSAFGEVVDTEVNLYSLGTESTAFSGNIFGGGKGSYTANATSGNIETKVTGNAKVNLVAATVAGSIYGGCNVNGTVEGGTVVTLIGGQVGTDATHTANVFGGGYGHNTYVKGDVKVNVGEDRQSTGGTTIYGDVYGGSAQGYVNAYLKTTTVGETTSTSVDYSTSNSTTVNLNAGIIYGDAYGGGLGQKTGFDGATADVAAEVGGAVNVNVQGVAFKISNYTDEGHTDVVKTGRVFGCNNLYGSPKGNVTVTVSKTVGLNNDGTINSTKPRKKSGSYEIAAVYGGGNLAPYEASGKKAHVIIRGCDDISIQTVYGGGNAAAVPESDVDIYSAYEIGSVFGGGNGKDMYKTDAEWVENAGANVNGPANTLIYGGTIHEAYGGSNEKGAIAGTVTIDISGDNPDGCPLDVAKVVGAGKNADVNGDMIAILGCKPETKIPLFYAGADNANVNGNVELTITSGNFGRVFGGNNEGGVIKGHIKVNIEETGNCGTPITIDELYLGGNEAAYSIYGYYQDASDDNKLKPRTAEMHRITDSSAEGYIAPDTNPATDYTHSFPYAQPELNVISCTYIGRVFGGGYGTGAVMYADPTVNINMIPGSKASDVPTFMATKSLDASENPSKLGVIGDVYGGGNAADVVGNPTVNIGTATTVKLHKSYDKTTIDETHDGYAYSEEQTVLGAYITGDVFGGGMGEATTFECEKAMVGLDGDGVDNPNGGTTVNIYKGLVIGNVYGGGRIARVEKNTAVTIGTGDGTASATPNPIIKGNVFGAGKGLETHGYAALVRGNPTVTIQGNAKVEKSVYGGGEIASVARYQIVDGVPVALAQVTEGQHSGYCKVEVKGYAEIGPDGMKMYHSEITDGTDKPDDWGHVFAAGKGVLPQNYTYTDKDHMPRRMMLYKDKKSSYWEYADPAFVEPEDATANDLANQDVWEYLPTEKDYFDFIETLALATQTEVTIGGHAFVKGSVYGGSENGLVQYDTQVNIEDECQIGSGDGVNRRYTTAEWTYDGSTTEKSLAECAHWDYVATSAAPYDPHAKYLNPGDGKYYYDEAHTKYAEGGRRIATDGHTYYGNVFGGGSGSVPYFDTTNGVSRYIMTAGQVKGNTNVTISGGHILTNVYGGCEATNVLGEATVKMSAGTLGVPRTLAQIDAHPVTCYLFGAGKGDQRIFFNKDTNVENVKVEITGGKIFGSVFGGGEDGHVHRDVTMTIGKDDHTGPTIGNWGTSYVDGNIFGGGRGFGGDAYTAGNVAGSITMEIKGGDILGSIYGGGRLGSVGYGLFDAGVSGYGEMRPDNTVEDSNPTSATNFKRGYVNITISGGTIGNTLEYKVPNATNITAAGISETDISKWTATEWTTWKNHYNIPKTEFDSNGHLTHTKGGNVFTGGMGRFYQLDGTTPISSIDWWKLGNVKTTTLTITGGEIKSSVYGGGELGMVQGTHPSASTSGIASGKAVSTEINVSGGIIGTEVMDGETVKYTFGSVFGGGYGSLLEKLTHTGYKPASYPKYIAGRVKGSTEVTISGTAAVKASVYGGGEMAAVGESKVLASQTDPVVPGETLTGTSGAPMEANTYVTINGGTIGKDKDTENTISYGGATMGNVYGGGSGSNNTVRSGHVYGNTNVTITDGTIYHNVYGGGAYGTVGDFTYNTEYDADAETKKVVGINDLHTDRTGTGTATINITGGTIGVDGHENGMVFGSSRGDINKPRERDDYTAWVYNANVTIGTEGQGTTLTTPLIKGSVYGSGENGHTYNNTIVTVNSGTIGDASDASYAFRGNVYGGGCGTDKYYSGTVPDGHKANDGGGDSFNTLAGVVYGTTTVNINGGQVVRNVYGAGAMGSVGKAVSTSTTEGETTTTTTTVTGGTTTINVSDGTIGVSGTAGDGNVFGAARGDVDATINEYALVRKGTNVSVTGGTIKGNVYGGGELGCVGTFTHSTDYKTFTWKTIDGNDNTDANDKNTGLCNVTINGGSAVINGKVFGAGKGKEDSFWCEKGIAYSTNVEISDGTVNGNVYGGGEVGRVETDTEVKIGNGAGTEGGTSTPTISGSVFGGGAGVETHGYSALVRGNTQVTVEGNAQVAHSVYGGGEIASVGRYGLDAEEMPSILQGGGDCKVTIQGYANIGTDVFGAGKGVTPKNYTYTDNEHSPKRMILRTALKEGDISEDYETGSPFVWHYLKDNSAYETYLETLALTTAPDVTIGGNATVGKSVYGGGELGLTKGSVAVNIIGGTITEDVYGGGSLANTNTTNQVDNNGDGVAETTVDPTTTVNLLGGTIRNAYGGGLGQKKGVNGATSDIEAIVFGDVLVDLNGTTTITKDATGKKLYTSTPNNPSKRGCVVKGYVFGTNNVNGTPKGHVLVHVHGTQNENLATINDKKVISVPAEETTAADYDVAGVFGGGNAADYIPTDAEQSTEVIIEGCNLTSIYEVYGGGYGAATPGTNVLINGSKIINKVFGGGYGAGESNPGANVGIRTNGTPYGIGVVDGTIVDEKTKIAVIQLKAGKVNSVFGGSNTLGDIRNGASITTLTTDDTGAETVDPCDILEVGELYGGGNEAVMEGGAEIVLRCMPDSWIGEVYAGARKADVGNDVSLTITSGKFEHVYGGNKSDGKIDGYVEVNIEECPTCGTPVIIGELYGGGNEAPYTLPASYGADYQSPRVNVRAFTSIGSIYGGGKGEDAVVKGNPTVSINVGMVDGGGQDYEGDTRSLDGNNVTLYPHEKNKIGVIGNVFGGGNAAKVDGNTNVFIGTESYVKLERIVAEETNVDNYYTRSGDGTETSPYVYTKASGKALENTVYYLPVLGVDIRGNVYGGGNQADVTGKTNVVIGQRIDN